jgi:hypothetical protein
MSTGWKKTSVPGQVVEQVFQIIFAESHVPSFHLQLRNDLEGHLPSHLLAIEKNRRLRRPKIVETLDEVEFGGQEEVRMKLDYFFAEHAIKSVQWKKCILFGLESDGVVQPLTMDVDQVFRVLTFQKG